jgi:UDP-glucose 4-epimerase
MTKLDILVTGSSGYIGGQTVLALRDLGHRVVGVDWTVPSAALSLAMSKWLVADTASPAVTDLINTQRFDAIIHCAGTSLVGPSMVDPQAYYHNNVVRSQQLIQTWVHSRNRRSVFVFSSSAAVYGQPINGQCHDQDPTVPINPYGQSKLMVEMMLRGWGWTHGLHWVAFRYFNAAGADEQGRHGQAAGATHILARALKCARDGGTFELYGQDYDTPDGTCLRDYVHVADIAAAHCQAAAGLVPAGHYNLGLGLALSNQQALDLVAQVTGRRLQITVGPRRAGDPAVLCAVPSPKLTNFWKPAYHAQHMVEHAAQWYNS